MSKPILVESTVCEIIFKSPQGTYTFDALDLDILIYQAHKLKKAPDDPSWVPELRRMIKEKYDISISGVDALNLVEAVNDAILSLKKTPESTPSLQPPTESIPSS